MESFCPGFLRWIFFIFEFINIQSIFIKRLFDDQNFYFKLNLSLPEQEFLNIFRIVSLTILWIWHLVSFSTCSFFTFLSWSNPTPIF